VAGGEDAALAGAIYRKKGNGADTGGNVEVFHTATDVPRNPIYAYRILRPTPIRFWIRLTLGAGSNPSPDRIAALQRAIHADFYGSNPESGNPRVGLASTVYASRFFCPALAVAEFDSRNIQRIGVALSADAPDDYSEFVSINGDQEPVLTLDAISVVVAQ